MRSPAVHIRMNDDVGSVYGSTRVRMVRRPLPRGLRVEVVTPSGGPRAPGLAVWLAAVAPRAAQGTVTIAIVSDGRIRTLTRKFRGRNVVTDVLSFPVGEAGHLGDIVIAAGVVRRQARAEGHALRTEVRVLALHGLLHLLGYDHEIDQGRMARVERRLRRRGGLPVGVIERGSVDR
jgi:probable rRNA maturation factor